QTLRCNDYYVLSNKFSEFVPRINQNLFLAAIAILSKNFSLFPVSPLRYGRAKVIKFLFLQLFFEIIFEKCFE
ncbi:MAG: hypothetical protein ACI9D1_000667, partial [Cryomorphaceae bacterium]